MSLRTPYSSHGWLSSEPVLSHQPYKPAVQGLIQFNSLEKGVQRDREQKGEMDATSHEGPHARLLQNYSSLQINYELEFPPLTVRNHFYVTVLHRQSSLWWDGERKRTIMGLPNKAKSLLRVWG